MNKKYARLSARKILCLLLSFVMISGAFTVLKPVTVNAETELPADVIISVDGGEAVMAKGLYVGYEYNMYVSLIDLQRLTRGTAKEFSLGISGGMINIITQSAINSGVPINVEDGFPSTRDYDRAVSGWSDGEKSGFSNRDLAANRISFNGEERKYYTVVTTVGDYADCFMHIIDFCMIMDLDANYDGSSITINTNSGFQIPSPLELESQGFFQGVNGLLVGDATTGEIFYGYNAGEVYPIASTTKLMTYLLMAEAIENGSISMDDLVPVSKVAEVMSTTADGLIPMREGQMIPLRELIEAALIISSNECDHTVSEHFGGSEDNIVAMMNDKAAQLSMTTAVFYNCNGLPIYTQDEFPSKKQNRMSCEDMFKLSSYILNNYPQIKEITSKKFSSAPSLGKDLKNTNALLYNMPEVNGLKTGTTNKSGACLVTSLTVNDGTMDHDLVVVELGAETSSDRVKISEIMARYGKAVVLGTASKVNTSAPEVQESISAGSIVNMIVNKAMQRKLAQ